MLHIRMFRMGRPQALVTNLSNCSVSNKMKICIETKNGTASAIPPFVRPTVLKEKRLYEMHQVTGVLKDVRLSMTGLYEKGCSKRELTTLFLAAFHENWEWWQVSIRTKNNLNKK